jgi:hypothetical protein
VGGPTRSSRLLLIDPDEQFCPQNVAIIHFVTIPLSKQPQQTAIFAPHRVLNALSLHYELRSCHGFSTLLDSCDREPPYAATNGAALSGP